MSGVSKRQLLGGLGHGAALVGAAKVAAATPARPAPVDPDDARRLIDYFGSKAPLLLREAGGHLKYPSISPSLPCSQYSTELWDWDTMWTMRGLFHVARLTGDTALRDRIAAHG